MCARILVTLLKMRPHPRGTSTFLIQKNTGTVENRLQITVELKFILLIIKANLMLDEIRLKKFP